MISRSFIIKIILVVGNPIPTARMNLYAFRK